MKKNKKQKHRKNEDGPTRPAHTACGGCAARGSSRPGRSIEESPPRALPSVELIARSVRIDFFLESTNALRSQNKMYPVSSSLPAHIQVHDHRRPVSSEAGMKTHAASSPAASRTRTSPGLPLFFFLFFLQSLDYLFKYATATDELRKHI
jgi:hypothetical protein